MDLVLEVGKPGFLTAFATYLRSRFGIASYVITAWSGAGSAPRLLATSAPEPSSPPDDEAAHPCAPERGDGWFVWPLLSSRDPDDPRRKAVEGRGAVDRLQMSCWQGAVCYAVSLYRLAGQPTFSPSDVEALSRAAPLALNLVARHFEAGASDGPITEQELEGIVRELSPASPLTQREAQVCTLILLGYSTEAISLRLGIASHSVQTYRRRAYRRLSIAAQNELFARVLQRFGALYGRTRVDPAQDAAKKCAERTQNGK